MGRVLGQLNLLLNPQQIILAGPLSELDEAFMKPVRESVEQQTPNPNCKQPQIVASEFGDFGGALGAAALAVYQWNPRLRS